VNYTRAPIPIPVAAARGTKEPGIRTLTARGIFSPQPSGGIHFVIITLCVYFVLMVIRLIYYVYCRRKNAKVTDPADVSVIQSLITHHVWLSMILPCTYHCGHKHITLAVCSLMGMYAVISVFISNGGGDLILDLRAQIFLGVFAAFSQACIRPILNSMFFVYSIYDATELMLAEKPVEFEFNEADYVEDIEMLAPKHFEDEDLIEMDIDDDDDLQFAEMTMDEVLERTTTQKMQMGGSIGRAHLDTALDGLDTAMPIDDEDIILEKGFDDDDFEPIADDEIDIDMELDTPENGSQAPASRMGTMTGTLTGTKRGRTLKNLGAELIELDESSDGGMPVETATTTTDPEDESYEDNVVVTRYLHNYTRYGFAVCFVYLALTALVTILNTSGWTKETLDAFWWTMLCASVASFFAIEPLLMAAVYLYRWLLGDEENDVTADMHPFDGEERYRDDA
jgi:hypothetical protein